MPVFNYTATTYEGTVVEGLIEASDERIAIERLKSSGVIPLKISVPKEGLRKRFALRSARGEILVFTTELSALLGAGLPLDRSLNILSEITEGKEMKNILQAILRSIREGSSFSDALQRNPKVFSRLYISMVRAGEAGGVLDEILGKLNEFLESSQELKESILMAMIYPVILALTGGASIVILLTFVIPKFSVIFQEIGGSLPLATQLILSVSNGLRATWYILFPAVIVLAVWIKIYINSEKGRHQWDRVKMKVVGDIVRKLETARFCRTLGTLMNSGVPFLQALNNSTDIIGNQIVADAVRRVAKDVKEGKGLAVPFSEAKVFPPLAVSMIKVGEETGQLQTMLLKVAATYEKSLRDSIKKFMGVLEPGMILIMGLVIGFIVISILMAIFSITDLPV